MQRLWRHGRQLLAGVLATMVLGSLAEADPRPAPRTGGCLERAAAWAEVNPMLLRAIAWVESRGNPRALNWNRNGTYDVGLMQINSSWYHQGLKLWWRHMGHPCVNVAAGAWVLKQCIAVHGYTWDAVGCYNAGADWKRSVKRAPLARAYIAKVQAALRDAGLPMKGKNGRNVLLTEAAAGSTLSP